MINALTGMGVGGGEIAGNLSAHVVVAHSLVSGLVGCT
jgi:hypothetical protein